MVSISDPFKAIASWFTPSSKGKEIVNILQQIAKGNFDHTVRIPRSEKDQEHRQILRGLRLTLKELKKMEQRTKSQHQQILRANKQLKQLDKNKREFMELASHQLKTPLASMQLGLDLLRRRTKEWEADDKVIFDQIEQSYIHLSTLVRSVLAAVKVDEKMAMEPQFRTISILQIFKALNRQFANRFKAKEIAFTIEEPQGGCKLKTDPEFLIEILHNLLENALKYTQEGEVILYTHIKEETIEFVVKDTGIGVPVEEQKKVFEKLFRASNVKNMADIGSGLGLYYTKQLVKKLGGKIWFDSSSSTGSEFHVILPRKRPVQQF